MPQERRRWKKVLWITLFSLVLLAGAAAGLIWYLQDAGMISLPEWVPMGEQQGGELPRLQEELRLAQEEKAQLQQQLEQVQAALDAARRELQNRQPEPEDVQAYQQLLSTANMMAKMSASKAVPILTAMPTEEAILILKSLGDRERRDILARLNPATAAEYTLYLQATPELDESSYREVRNQLIGLVNGPRPVEDASFTNEELAATLNAMDNASAAEILERWYRAESQGALALLRLLPTQKRAAVLAEMETEIATALARNLAIP